MSTHADERVERVHQKSDGQAFLVKRIPVPPGQREVMVRRLRTLKTFVHFNVLRSLDHRVRNETELLAVLEDAPGGTVDTRLALGTPFAEEELWIVVIQIFQGLQALHDHHVFGCHLDAHTVRLDAHRNIKLDALRFRFDEPAEAALDVWRAGVLLLRLMRHPAPGPPFEGGRWDCAEEQWQQLMQRFSIELCHLVRKLVSEVLHRPSVAEVLKYSAVSSRIQAAVIRSSEIAQRKLTPSKPAAEGILTQGSLGPVSGTVDSERAAEAARAASNVTSIGKSQRTVACQTSLSLRPATVTIGVQTARVAGGIWSGRWCPGCLQRVLASRIPGRPPAPSVATCAYVDQLRVPLPPSVVASVESRASRNEPAQPPVIVRPVIDVSLANTTNPESDASPSSHHLPESVSSENASPAAQRPVTPKTPESSPQPLRSCSPEVVRNAAEPRIPLREPDANGTLDFSFFQSIAGSDRSSVSLSSETVCHAFREVPTEDPTDGLGRRSAPSPASVGAVPSPVRPVFDEQASQRSEGWSFMFPELLQSGRAETTEHAPSKETILPLPRLPETLSDIDSSAVLRSSLGEVSPGSARRKLTFPEQPPFPTTPQRTKVFDDATKLVSPPQPPETPPSLNLAPSEYTDDTALSLLSLGASRHVHTPASKLQLLYQHLQQRQRPEAEQPFHLASELKPKGAAYINSPQRTEVRQHSMEAHQQVMHEKRESLVQMQAEFRERLQTPPRSRTGTISSGSSSVRPSPAASPAPSPQRHDAHSDPAGSLAGGLAGSELSVVPNPRTRRNKINDQRSSETDSSIPGRLSGHFQLLQRLLGDPEPSDNSKPTGSLLELPHSRLKTSSSVSRTPSHVAASSQRAGTAVGRTLSQSRSAVAAAPAKVARSRSISSTPKSKPRELSTGPARQRLQEKQAAQKGQGTLQAMVAWDSGDSSHPDHQSPREQPLAASGTSVVSFSNSAASGAPHNDSVKMWLTQLTEQHAANAPLSSPVPPSPERPAAASVSAPTRAVGPSVADSDDDEDPVVMLRRLRKAAR